MDIFITKSNAGNKQELIHELFSFLLTKGYVKETYEDAINNREVDFPTGLELTGDYNVAIPHAESEHVNKPAIVLAQLQNSIQWENMEDPDSTLPVHLVFLLAIKDPKLVVPNLKALTENVFSKPDVVSQLKNSSDLESSKIQLKQLVEL